MLSLKVGVLIFAQVLCIYVAYTPTRAGIYGYNAKRNRCKMLSR